MGKKVSCKICYLTENTGFDIPHDLDVEYHKGFTVGNGKAMYWMITWHPSGNCSVYRKDDNGEGLVKRWLSGDAIITIHYK